MQAKDVMQSLFEIAGTEDIPTLFVFWTALHDCDSIWNGNVVWRMQ